MHEIELSANVMHGNTFFFTMNSTHVSLPLAQACMRGVRPDASVNSRMVLPTRSHIVLRTEDDDTLLAAK